MIKLLWLSFCDPRIPDGEGKSFLGACLVAVDNEDALHAFQTLDVMSYKTGDEWTAAALIKSWELGCNPGGQVVSFEVDITKLPTHIPRNKLMRYEELKFFDLID